MSKDYFNFFFVIQVAASPNNSLCAVGIAFNAQIGGIRMLDGQGMFRDEPGVNPIKLKILLS